MRASTCAAQVASAAGARALRARGTRAFATLFDSCGAARRRLAARLTDDDARYLAFQLWKEGVARYTEYAVARVAAARYLPSPRYQSLDDYTSFAAEADNVLRQILEELSSLTLSSWKRIAVYPAGAADALLLDERRPRWKTDYVRERFALDRLFPRGR